MQEQAGEGAEVALRFYSSVPNTDYKVRFLKSGLH